MSFLANKRVLIILLPILITLGALVGVYFYFKPKMQHWILRQVARLSAEKLPVSLEIQSVNWTLLVPEVELTGISVSSKSGDFTDLPPITVQKVSASLDLLAIFTGRIAISSLLIENPVTTIQVDPYMKDTESTTPLPMDLVFEYLPKIPVSRLGLKAADITVISKKKNFSLRLQSSDLLVVNRKSRLSLQFDLNESIVKFGRTEIPFRLQGDANLTKDVLDLSNVKLGMLNSMLNVHGSFSDFPRIHIRPQGTLEYEIYSDLELTSAAAKDYFKIPELSGSVRSSGRLEMNDRGQAIAGFKMLGQKIKIDQFDVGDIQFDAQFADNLFKVSDIELTNEAGLVDVQNLEVELGEKDSQKTVAVRGKVKTDQLDINELLIRLGVGDIPVEGFIAANISCQGPLYPDLQIGCKGKTDAEQFEVRSGDRIEDLIVSVDEFGAQGDFDITKQGVKYQAQLRIQEDHGTSDGFISFKEGFKINYASPDLQLKNIRHLAGLKLEGRGALQGSTQGDSKAATFQMSLSPKNLYFENFFLGDVSGKLNYNSGTMHFSEIRGKINSTGYGADVTVDLNKKRVAANGELPKYELSDVFQIFERIYKMPVEITGTGKASVKVEGPFQLGKLSYDLNTTVFRGTAVGESFDGAEIHLISDTGEMKVQTARIVKNKNEVLLTGQSHPDGRIDLHAIGRSMPLEESENISRLGAQINGLLDVDVLVKGPILSAETSVKGRIYQLNIEEQDYPESSFEITADPQTLKGKTDLFAGQLHSDFIFPLVDGAPFQLDVKAKDWNYTTLFALIGAGALLNDYKSSLSGDLVLNSERGGLWTASGHGTLQNFFLQRGALSLQNKHPMNMAMKSGQITLSNFRLDGDQTFIEAKGRDFSRESFNLNVAAQANLRLLQIFVPFLEEFAGSAAANMDISGPLFKPEVLGTAKISNGFAKIKGFPHPFEKTQADIQFSQSKILINFLQGQIAGGNFTGGGSVAIEGPKNFPANVRAHLENVNFNVPDRIRTNGNADVNFAGSWFPFTLSGTYHVFGGFMDKELGGSADVANLRASSYLPKVILQGAFEPVLLDLNVVLEKPLTIKNSLIDGNVSGNLTVRGAPTQPALSGRIFMEKNSKITIQDKIFEVQAASIQFTGSTEINPDIYLTAKSRINEYDISILIQGPAQNITPRFSSTPPLSERDITSLIALGVTSQGMERQVESSQTNKTNSSEKNLAAVASGVLTKTEAFKNIQDKTGVQVQVSSSYDDTKSVSVQKITLSKKLSDKVKASATQVAGSRTAKEYSLQYNFTDNVSAIGRYEDRQPSENPTTIDSTARESQSIFGVDLEFKKEFK